MVTLKFLIKGQCDILCMNRCYSVKEIQAPSVEISLIMVLADKPMYIMFTFTFKTLDGFIIDNIMDMEHTFKDIGCSYQQD